MHKLHEFHERTFFSLAKNIRFIPRNNRGKLFNLPVPPVGTTASGDDKKILFAHVFFGLSEVSHS